MRFAYFSSKAPREGALPPPHPSSRNLRTQTFPASGIRVKWRYKTACALPPGLSLHGLHLKMARVNILDDLTDAVAFSRRSQPSSSTSTGTFCSLMRSCWAASFSLAATRRIFNSSSPGLTGSFHSLSIKPPFRRRNASHFSSPITAVQTTAEYTV